MKAGETVTIRLVAVEEKYIDSCEGCFLEDVTPCSEIVGDDCYGVIFKSADQQKGDSNAR